MQLETLLFQPKTIKRQT